MTNILPFNKPIIDLTSYTNLQLMIADTHPNGREWIYNNYVQIEYSHHEPFANHFYNNTHLYSLGCETNLLQYELIPYYFLKDLEVDQFIRNAINNGFYINLSINTFYIRAYKNYNKFDKIHNLTIYGYSEQSFYISDFFNYSTPTEEVCSESALLESFYSAVEIANRKEMYLFRVNKDTTYNFDLSLLQMYLLDYLEARNTYSRIVLNDSYCNLYYYGISVYDGIINAIQEEEINLSSVFMGLDLLYKHKLLMLKRLDFLDERHYINSSEKMKNELVLLRDGILKIRNYFFKFRISGRKVIVQNNFKEKLEKLKGDDFKFTKSLYEQLMK